MQGNFDRSLAFTLDPQQDGQPLHTTPGDPGGATNLGVTIPALTDYLGRPATVEDIEALTRQSVRPIYATKFWQANQCDRLPTGIDLLVFDFSVYAGVHSSARCLQRALAMSGPDQDGWIGARTLAAANSRPVGDLITSLATMQHLHLSGLGDAPSFLHGWDLRLMRCKHLAEAWVSGVASPPPVAPAPVPASDPDNSADALMAQEQQQLDSGQAPTTET